jgi:Protein of unknown function (DUF2867).
VKIMSTSTTSKIAGRLPESEFRNRPWRIHQIAGDFDLIDVWQLPTPGGPGDLRRLVEIFAAGTMEGGDSPIVRLVWSVRWGLGKLLHWDDPQNGVGIRVPSLRARLPADLVDAPIGPDFARLPFTSLYLLSDEFAAELANSTCHGVLHMGWVQTEPGCYTAQLAILSKPNGTKGRLYTAGIQPFRHSLIYPALLRKIERSWAALDESVQP